jgi:hypothetical protein
MAWLRPGFSGWAWVGLGLQARARTSLASTTLSSLHPQPSTMSASQLGREVPYESYVKGCYSLPSQAVEEEEGGMTPVPCLGWQPHLVNLALALIGPNQVVVLNY